MPIPPDSTVSAVLNLSIQSRPEIRGVDGPALDALCDAIAEVITATIKEGLVTGTIVGVSPSGAVTGTCTGAIS